MIVKTIKQLLRDTWSASDFETDAVARHARDAMRREAKQGVYAMALLTLLMMLGVSWFYVYLGLATEHLYTFALLGLLSAHVAISARKLPETADLKVLYLLGMVLLSLTALAFTLIAQKEGKLTGATLSTVVLLFMIVPLVPWGMREALLALGTIYTILTGSTLSAASRFAAHDVMALQFLMLGAALIALAVVARTVLVRKGHLEARFDLFRANEQLVKIAMHDPLTGAKNRRFLEKRFGLIAMAYAKANQPYYYCVLDIDKFKALNDTYGHICGDAVLRRLAGALATAFDADDHVVRMGGDEFVIITRCEDLHARFARVLALNAPDAAVSRGSPCASVSLGAARVPAGVLADFDALYLCADKALYEAKAAGGGSVVETTFAPPGIKEQS